MQVLNNGKHNKGRILSFNESFTYQPATPNKKAVEKLINFLTNHRETFLNYAKYCAGVGHYGANNSICRYGGESLSPTRDLIFGNTAMANDTKRSNDTNPSDSSSIVDDCQSKGSISPTVQSDVSSSASRSTIMTGRREHPSSKVYLATLNKFEILTEEALANSSNNELRKILRDHGWSGTRFRSTAASGGLAFEFELLLQDLSNLYLRSKNNGIFSPLNIFVERNYSGEKDLSQIISFCPDILVEYLRTSIRNTKGFSLLSTKRSKAEGMFLISLKLFLNIIIL